MHGSRAAAVPEKIKTNAGQKARKRTSIVGGKSRLLLAYFREGQTKSLFISGYRKFVSDTTRPTVDDDAAPIVYALLSIGDGPYILGPVAAPRGPPESREEIDS